MNISIYDDYDLIGNALAAALVQTKEYGPKMFKWIWDTDSSYDKNDITHKNIVSDRNWAIDSGYLNSIQAMENECGNGTEILQTTFLDGFFEQFKDEDKDPATAFEEAMLDTFVVSKYENVVWANWFGTVSAKYPKLNNHDKLILCQTRRFDAAMNYCCEVAMRPISLGDVDLSTENWRMDHVEQYGSNIGEWTDLWYNNWHEQCKNDYADGKLKYFFQLNHLHWDLFHTIKGIKTDKVKMYTIDQTTDVVREVYKGGAGTFDSTHMGRVIETNPDGLVIDSMWHSNLEPIQDHLSMTFNDKQLSNISRYKTQCQKKIDYFKEHFPDLKE